MSRLRETRPCPSAAAHIVLATAVVVALLASALQVATLALPARAATSMDALRRFAVPAGSLQVVLVRSSAWSSTSATVEFFQRTSATAAWTSALPAQSGRVGYGGMVEASARRQSTGTTPAGIFSLPSAFGGAANPGTAMSYRRFDGDDWWPYDPADPSTYNVYQTSRPAGARWRTAWAERLADYYQGTNRQYAYGVVLDFNLPAAYQAANTGLGGGIFLHVSGTGATAGCISISEAAMASTLRWLTPSAKPVLVSGPTTWLDDTATTTAGLSTMTAPGPYRSAPATFTAVARPARLQWWRLTTTNACTGATVSTASGQGASPVVATWNGTVSGSAAPAGLYRMSLEAGTSTWTAQTSLAWVVEVYATGKAAMSGCPADRLSGADRYATSVAVAREAAPTARTVVLAGGEDAHLVDGLVAGPLAARWNAALLLTATASLSPATAAEITRRGTTSVIVVGSSGAVSDAVLTSVRALGVGSVRRVQGATRYETAAAVAAEVGSPDGGAFVAAGADANLVDGLAASGPAVRLRRPILLTSATQLPAVVTSTLASISATRTDVIGSADVVSDTVLAQLPSPRRLGGVNRYETARAVAMAFTSQVGTTTVVLGSGVGSLVDNLPGGTLGRLIVLTAGTLPATTATWLAGSGASRLVALGGPSSTTPAALDAAIRSI